MFPRAFRRETGFTLVEALIAATIMATALVSLAYLAALGIRQSTASARALTALAAAQGKLEQLLAGTITVGSGEHTGDSLLQWTIAPVPTVGSALFSVQVCAYSTPQAAEPADACVATLRGNRP